MIRAIGAVVFLAGAVYGQPAATRQFDVASVKLSTADPRAGSGIASGHGRIDGENVTLKRCIMGAYGVGPEQIAGGPAWLDTDRYQILAKSSDPRDGDAELMVQLQNLLAERFQLVLHRETRNISAYVLEVAKNGPKMEKAGLGESATSTSTGPAGVTIDARYMEMEAFAKVLARKTELPVINRTGLEGAFHFKLEWTPDNVRAARRDDAGGSEAPSLFSALQEQLGLRLRSVKTGVEILVIDRAERPTLN